MKGNVSMETRSRLTRLAIKRISLVDAPACEEAQVVLFKRAGGDDVEMRACAKCKNDVEKDAKFCKTCGWNLDANATLKDDVEARAITKAADVLCRDFGLNHEQAHVLLAKQNPDAYWNVSKRSAITV